MDKKLLLLILVIIMAALMAELDYERIALANDHDRTVPTIGVMSPSTGKIRVLWSAPATRPKDYRLSWGKLNGNGSYDFPSWKDSNTSSAGNAYPAASATSYTISGLDQGTYKVMIRARYNDNQSGAWVTSSYIEVAGAASQRDTVVPPPVMVITPEPTSEPVAVRQTEAPAAPTAEPTAEPAMLPGAPPNVQTAQRNAGLLVIWSRLSGPVDSYRLRYRLVGSSSSWRTVVRNPGTTAYPTTGRENHELITGLTNRSRYEVQVSAVNSGGAGPWSSSARGTPQAPSHAPVQSGAPALNVGALRTYWVHDDADGNWLQVPSCTGDLNFRAFWAGPEGETPATEWEAHINTRFGAGRVTHNFSRAATGAPNRTTMNGTVNVEGYSSLTVYIRGRFGNSGWGEWSPGAGLYCAEQQ